jgi:hypothetical protein
MTIEVDEASATVRLALSGDYTAEQLLDLLKQLSAARARIAKDPARPADIWVAPKASCHVQMLPPSGPESLLAVNFPGIGWIGATLSPGTRAQVISLLAAQQATVATAAPAPAAPTVTVCEVDPGPGGKTLH